VIVDMLLDDAFANLGRIYLEHPPAYTRRRCRLLMDATKE
jgi:hypothetical protein